MLGSSITWTVLPFEASWELKSSPGIPGQDQAQLLAALPSQISPTVFMVPVYFHYLSPTVSVPMLCQIIQTTSHCQLPGMFLQDLAALNAMSVLQYLPQPPEQFVKVLSYKPLSTSI